VCIPDVIYFSEPKDNKTSSISGLTSTSTKHPWGLFSYVGEGSNHILNNSMDENGTENETEKQWVACEDFIRDMVKIRHEFGFDEPHPRHGRVNTNQALEYAFHVLDTVILPLHTAFYDEYYNNTTSNATGLHIMTSNENTLLQKDGLDIGWNNYISSSKYDNINSNINPSTSKTAIRPCRYNDMIELYQVIVSYLKKAVTSKMPTSTNTSSKINHDIKMEELMNVLDKCVQTLQYETLETNREENDGLPPVLCHMDLQPQNMILCREENKQCSLELSGEIPHIFSVLDWEESCYADPRFELLLLCRKVVANRDQANILWEHYAMVMLDRFGKMMNRNESQTKTSVLGSIEPWLKLETVHSLITLSMQGLNLGGRNSWEGQSELWNKILREVKRLVDLGWNFCNRILDC
jgi:thiamine kinase-like enzyme